MRSMSPLLFIAALLATVLLTTPLRAADPPYLASLLEAAREQRLHADPFWHTLIHYKRGLLGVRSLIDDPRFFLSPQAKYDPEAELEATIRAFFEPGDDETQHA